MFLLDTSVLVTALTPESGTGAVHQWIMLNRLKPLAMTTLALTEFSAAIAKKVRANEITSLQQENVLSEFKRLRPLLSLVDLSFNHYVVASQICDRHQVGMRALDALHMSAAWIGEMRLVTRDKRLFQACGTFGIDSELLA